MNKELADKCKELNQTLKADPMVKEYYDLKDKLNDTSYEQLEERIKELQKKLVNKIDQGEDGTEIKEELKVLHDQYFNSPLVVNYSYLMEQVNLLYQYVNDYINGAIQLN